MIFFQKPRLKFNKLERLPGKKDKNEKNYKTISNIYVGLYKENDAEKIKIYHIITKL